MTALTKSEFWAELDDVGEVEVRVRLQTKIYSDLNEKGAFAREWLLRRDLASADASSSLQRRTARSAKNAAWVAAIAAIIAAIFSIVSLFPKALPWLSELISSALSR